METLFILIGLFLGAQDIDVRIIDTYARPGLCNQHALFLTKEAQEEGKPYQFYCRGAKFTQA